MTEAVDVFEEGKHARRERLSDLGRCCHEDDASAAIGAETNSAGTFAAYGAPA